MNVFKKQVSEIVPISVDFTNLLATSETVASMTAVATDTDGTVVTSTIIDSNSITTPICYVTVKAGTSGTRYTITIVATTSSSNVYEEDVFLDVYTDINMLIDVRRALRIISTSFDDEINDLILACKDDLQLCGLLGEKILDTDALIKRAIIVYCKTNYGLDNPDAERFQKSYDMLKNHMSLSTDYSYFTITFVVVNASAVVIDEAKITFDGVTKYTNSAGTAVFYMHGGNNYTYAISHEDYINYVDSDGDNYNVDVSASATIDITMTTS